MYPPPSAGRHAAEPAAVPAGLSHQQWQRRELVVWGAHGGAGTSTLATWLQPSWDAGAMPPGSDPAYPADVATGRVLVVACRSTVWSAAQATRAVAAVSQLGGYASIVAVVSDGWPEPSVAACRLRLLEPQVDAVIRVPFVPGLRLADDPGSVPLPRRVLRALAQIQAAAGRSFPL